MIRLECKSVKQLKRTCKELEKLGVESFCLSSINKSVGVGFGVSFYVECNRYTRGRQSTPKSPDEMYYTRKEFMAAVKHVLGESKL